MQVAGIGGSSARRFEVALLVASLLLSNVAIAPERHALAGLPIATTRSVGPGTGATAPCDAASVTFKTGVVGDGSDAAAIQAAVDASLTGDTVFLCDHVYELTTGITVGTSGLTLRGETTTGTAVSGGDSVRLFDATGKDVAFIGLTLTHGRSAGNGGAVKAARVAAIGAAFTDNSAGMGGGAIWASTSVAVTDGTFTRNTDTSLDWGGGAILLYSDNGTVSIDGGTFNGNTSRFDGGAVHAAYSGSVSITGGATFIGNLSGATAFYGGGAIKAREVTVVGGTFADNAALAGSGGAIFAEIRAEVSGATFIDNTSGGSLGGGAILVSYGGALSLTDGSFSGNLATNPNGYGGAITVAGRVEISGATFTNNVAAGYYGGGAVYIDSAEPASITDSIFTGNSAPKIDGYGGGAVASWQAQISVERSRFTGNSAGASGTYFGGGAIYTWLGGIAVRASTFAGNTAPNGGGGAIGSANLAATVVDSTFVENSAGTVGGAVYSWQAVEITNGTFVDNTAASGGHIAVRPVHGTMTAAHTILAGGTCAATTQSSLGLNLTTDASCPGEVTSGTALDLTPLADNGGPTPTVALGKGSVARDATAGIDGGLPCFTASDQRGETRPYNIRCDIGAFEGPVPGPAVTLEFAGAYWMKPSGTLTTVPLTTYVLPAVAGCTVTFSVSDGTRTFGSYAVTTDQSWDTTTASLPKGTYSITLLGSGGCDGATASGRLTIATGQSTAGTTASGDYTSGASTVTFSHAVSTATAEAKRGSGVGTTTTTTLSWSPSATWRLTASRTDSLPDGRGYWIRMACPEDVGGLRPASCGRLLTGVQVEELTTGTKGRKTEWVYRGYTLILVTVYDGGTSCVPAGRKQVCTALPDWYGIEYVDGYAPSFAATLMTGTMTRIRSGTITAD